MILFEWSSINLMVSKAFSDCAPYNTCGRFAEPWQYIPSKRRIIITHNNLQTGKIDRIQLTRTATGSVDMYSLQLWRPLGSNPAGVHHHAILRNKTYDVAFLLCPPG